MIAAVLALALALTALAAAIGVIVARSLISMIVWLVALGAAAAAALVTIGRGDSGMALALLMVGWTPPLLLAATLLTTSVVRPQAAQRWFGIAGGASAALALGFAVWRAPMTDQLQFVAPHASVAWMAALPLVAGLACLALLGYGERGVIDDPGAQAMSRPPMQIVAVGAAQSFVPLIIGFALMVLVTRAPGSGAGLLAGMGFGLALVLYGLVFGAAAALKALPVWFSRCVLAAGLAGVVIAAAAPAMRWSAQLAEGALFAVTVAAAQIIIVTLFGRAATLRAER